MSEVELVLVNDTDKCTIYTIQFAAESETEYERFYSKFIADAKLNQDLLRIVQLVDKIADEELWNVSSARRVRCAIRSSHSRYFAQNSDFIVSGFPTKSLSSATEE